MSNLPFGGKSVSDVLAPFELRRRFERPNPLVLGLKIIEVDINQPFHKKYTMSTGMLAEN